MMDNQANTERPNETETADNLSCTVPDTFTSEPESSGFQKWMKWSTYFSAVVCMVSFGMGIATIRALFQEGNREWFLLTLIFFLLSRMVTNIFSIVWYVHDDFVYLKRRNWLEKKFIASKCDWTQRIVCHMLLMGPWLRYFDLLKYGRLMKEANQTSQMLKAYKFANPYSMFIHEDRDIRMLELMQSFLGDTPQLGFQIYILAVRSPLDYYQPTSMKQLASIIISLYTTSWALSHYQKALRFAMPNKRNLSQCGSILQFLWRFGTITARLLSFSLFASTFKSWVFLVIAVHWSFMMIWITFQKTEFCTDEHGIVNQCQERLYDLVMAAISVTCYINVKDQPTRFKYLLYYTVTLAENSLMTGLWYWYANPKSWYHLPSFASVFFSFVAGIIFMLIYYGLYHPNGRLPAFTDEAVLC